MFLLVGLGNPGRKYKNTRHNVGFQFVDQLSKKKWEKSKNALYRWETIADQEVKLLKPQTFMNKSGRAVAYAAEKHGLDPSQIIVVHDEADLPMGNFKESWNRGSAGHKGVQSVIDKLGSKSFGRIRIGVGPNNIPLSDFVLEKMKPEEKLKIQEVISDIDIEEILKRRL